MQYGSQGKGSWTVIRYYDFRSNNSARWTQIDNNPTQPIKFNITFTAIEID